MRRPIVSIPGHEGVVPLAHRALAYLLLLPLEGDLVIDVERVDNPALLLGAVLGLVSILLSAELAIVFPATLSSLFL